MPRCEPAGRLVVGMAERRSMAREDEAQVQLATRIPKALQRALRLHCVTHETTIMDFVIAAVREKLTREGRRRSRRA